MFIKQLSFAYRLNFFHSFPFCGCLLKSLLVLFMSTRIGFYNFRIFSLTNKFPAFLLAASFAFAVIFDRIAVFNLVSLEPLFFSLTLLLRFGLTLRYFFPIKLYFFSKTILHYRFSVDFAITTVYFHFLKNKFSDGPACVPVDYINKYIYKLNELNM